MRQAGRVITAAVLAAVAGTGLAGCGSGGGGEASPSATSFDTLATTALVTKDDVTAIAGEGFEPYDSEVTASAADPAECLELLRFADGTRTAPPATASSATRSYARGSTGASITNTVHVLVDKAKADAVYHQLTSLVPTCKDFTAVVGAGVLKARIESAKTGSAGERSFGLHVVITSPTQTSDITTVVAQQGRTLVVGVAGTPDGADEADWATQTAQVSAQKAASIT